MEDDVDDVQIAASLSVCLDAEEADTPVLPRIEFESRLGPLFVTVSALDSVGVFLLTLSVNFDEGGDVVSEAKE